MSLNKKCVYETQNNIQEENCIRKNVKQSLINSDENILNSEKYETHLRKLTIKHGIGCDFKTNY